MRPAAHLDDDGCAVGVRAVGEPTSKAVRTVGSIGEAEARRRGVRRLTAVALVALGGALLVDRSGRDVLDRSGRAAHAPASTTIPSIGDLFVVGAANAAVGGTDGAGSGSIHPGSAIAPLLERTAAPLPDDALVERVCNALRFDASQRAALAAALAELRAEHASLAERVLARPDAAALEEAILGGATGATANVPPSGASGGVVARSNEPAPAESLATSPATAVDAAIWPFAEAFAEVATAMDAESAALHGRLDQALEQLVRDDQRPALDESIRALRRARVLARPHARGAIPSAGLDLIAFCRANARANLPCTALLASFTSWGEPTDARPDADGAAPATSATGAAAENAVGDDPLDPATKETLRRLAERYSSRLDPILREAERLAANVGPAAQRSVRSGVADGWNTARAHRAAALREALRINEETAAELAAIVGERCGARVALDWREDVRRASHPALFGPDTVDGLGALLASQPMPPDSLRAVEAAELEYARQRDAIHGHMLDLLIAGAAREGAGPPRDPSTTLGQRWQQLVDQRAEAAGRCRMEMLAVVPEPLRSAAVSHLAELRRDLSFELLVPP